MELAVAFSTVYSVHLVARRTLEELITFLFYLMLQGVRGVDIISMEVPEVAESGKDLVLDCNYDYRYHHPPPQPAGGCAGMY